MRTAGRLFLVAGIFAFMACGGDSTPADDTGGENLLDEVLQPDVPTEVAQLDPGTDVKPADVPEGATASCSNGVLDPDETDIDCGGEWCKPCGYHGNCISNKDCQSGWCNAKKWCGVGACDDGALNGSETDTDCGGTCTPCDDGKKCQVGGDCKSGGCVGGSCVVGTCTDGHKNGSETDKDCGGTCAPCIAGQACGVDADCVTGLCVLAVCKACKYASDCPGADTACRTRTCTDGACGATFGDEGTVAGGQVKGDCLKVVCDGQGSTKTVTDTTDVPDDSNPCTDDTCVDATPTHTNVGEGIAIAAQTAGDCKKVVCDGQGSKRTDNDDTDLPVDGTVCTDDRCAAGVASNPPVSAGLACSDKGGKVCSGAGKCVECASGGDCASGVCQAFTCVPASCKDTVKNGSETDTDCGGPSCGGCAFNQKCLLGTDCLDGVCLANKCAAASCNDGVKNGHETDIDCGGVDCAKCPANDVCTSNTDCLSGHCITGKCAQCLDKSECPAGAGECETPVCTNHVCDFTLAAFGVPSKTQVPGDCRTVTCDGKGGTVKIDDPTDVPVDNNPCTLDQCTGDYALPANPPALAGTPCTVGGGLVCDGSGACVQCNVTADCPTGTCVGHACVL